MTNSFSEKCYLIIQRVPFGKVVTYKSLASQLNSKAYRAVGNAMNKNKTLIKIPCHRVIRSDGQVGEYVLGRKKKIELLQKEGIKIVNSKINLKEYEFKFR